jgi:hypothetical protein
MGSAEDLIQSIGEAHTGLGEDLPLTVEYAQQGLLLRFWDEERLCIDDRGERGLERSLQTPDFLLSRDELVQGLLQPHLVAALDEICGSVRVRGQRRLEGRLGVALHHGAGPARAEDFLHRSVADTRRTGHRGGLVDDDDRLLELAEIESNVLQVGRGVVVEKVDRDDEENQVGAAQCRLSSFVVNCIARLHPRRVNEDHVVPGVLLNLCRGHVRVDEDLRSGEGLEETRLASVVLAGDHESNRSGRHGDPAEQLSNSFIGR